MFPRIFILVWCVSVLLSSPCEAAQEQGLETLSPDEATSLLVLWQELCDLDQRPHDGFKEGAWASIGEWLETYLRNAEDLDAALDSLQDTHFRACLPKEYREDLARLRTVAADPSRIQNPWSEGNLGRRDGKVVVPLPEHLMDCLWVLDAIEPWLLEASRSWTRRKVANDGFLAAEVETVLLDFLHDQRRMAKVRHLLAQDSWILHRVGLERTALAHAIAKVEGLESWSAALDGMSKLPSSAGREDLRQHLEEIQQGLDHKRRERAHGLPDACEGLIPFTSVTSAWFKSNGPTLVEVQANYQAIYATRFVDIPADGARSSNPFLRYRLRSPDNTSSNGLDTPLVAELFLCRVSDRARAVENAEVRGGDGLLQVGSEDLVAPLVEELALGIRMEDVVLRNGSLISLPSIRPKIFVDQETLLVALRQSGLPTPIQVSGLEVLGGALEDLHLALQLRLPGLQGWGAGLSALDRNLQIDVPLGIGSTGNGGLRETLTQALEQAQREYGKQLLDALQGGGRGHDFRVMALEPSGRWADGNFGYRLDLQLVAIGGRELEVPGRWSADLVCGTDGVGWSFRSPLHAPPGSVLDAVRDHARDSVFDDLDTGLLETFGGLVGDLSRYLVLERLVVDLEQGRMQGAVRFEDSVVPEGDSMPMGEFTVALRGPTATFDPEGLKPLKDDLGRLADILLEAMKDKVTGEIDAALADWLQDRTLDMGGGIKLTIGGRPKAAEAKLLIDAKLEFPRPTDPTRPMSMELRNLALIGGSLEDGEFKGPRFDFREVEIVPGLQKIFEDFTGAPPDILRISGEDFLPDGIRFRVGLAIPGLPGELPGVWVTLTTSGVSVDRDALEEELKDALFNLLEEVAGGELSLGDVGPVKNVRLDKEDTRLFEEPAVWVAAELPLEFLGGFTLEMSARVFPPFEVRLDQLDALIEEVIGDLPIDDLADNSEGKKAIEVANIEPSLAPPYGVHFDLTIRPWVFSIETEGIGITTRGLSLPDSLSVQVPGTIPIPTGFAIVNPGVKIPLRTDGKIGVMGDLTFAGSGVDKVVKVATTLSTALDRPEEFEIEGKLIVVDSLPLFQVVGHANFLTGRLSLETKTVGVMDKIVAVRGQSEVDATVPEFRQNGSVRVLGVEALETDVYLGPSALRATASVEIPIVTAEATLTSAPPDLSNFEFESFFEAEVAGYELAGASVFASIRIVEMEFEVLGMGLRVVAPGINSLTPDLILEAILKMFDFDIASLFEALDSGEITISLLDEEDKEKASEDGDPTGKGDPIPEGEEGRPEDAMESPEGGDLPEGQPGPEFTGNGTERVPTGGHDGPESQPGGSPGEEEQRGPAGGLPGSDSNEPIEGIVQYYETGDVAFRYVEDPDHPGRWVEEYTYGGKIWLGRFWIPDSVREHLKKKEVMVIAHEWRPLPHGQLTEDRFGNTWSHATFYVTLNTDREVHVVGRYPEGKPEPLEIDLTSIGQEVETSSWWGLIRSSEYRYTRGDIEAIRLYVRAAVDDRIRKPSHDRIVSTVGEESRVRYLFRLHQNKHDAVAYQLAPGNRLEIRDDSHLYRALRLGRADLTEGQPRAVLDFLADAALKGQSVDLLHTGGRSALLFRRSGLHGESPTLFLSTPAGFSAPIPVTKEIGYRRSGTDKMAWARFDPSFGDAVLATLQSRSWAEIRLCYPRTGNTGVLSAALTDGEDSGWTGWLYRKEAAGHAHSLGPFLDADLAAAYADWRAQGIMNHHPATGWNPSVRTWLLDELQRPRADWHPGWNIDSPITLLRLYLARR